MNGISPRGRVLYRVFSRRVCRYFRFSPDFRNRFYFGRHTDGPDSKRVFFLKKKNVLFFTQNKNRSFCIARGTTSAVAYTFLTSLYLHVKCVVRVSSRPRSVKSQGAKKRVQYASFCPAPGLETPNTSRIQTQRSRKLYRKVFCVE